MAASFSEDGSLRVNDDPPAVGRAAITGVVHSFTSAFPDLRVAMNDLWRAATRPSITGRLQEQIRGRKERARAYASAAWKDGAWGAMD